MIAYPLHQNLFRKLLLLLLLFACSAPQEALAADGGQTREEMKARAEKNTDKTEKIKLLDEMVETYRGSDNDADRDAVIWALYEKANASEGDEAKLSVIQAILDLYSDRPGVPDAIIARALFNKHRFATDAKMRIPIEEELFARYGGSSDEVVVKYLALTLSDKAKTATEPKEKIRVFKNIIERFGESPSIEVRRAVVRATYDWMLLTEGGEKDRLADNILDRSRDSVFSDGPMRRFYELALKEKLKGVVDANAKRELFRKEINAAGDDANTVTKVMRELSHRADAAEKKWLLDRVMEKVGIGDTPESRKIIGQELIWEGRRIDSRTGRLAFYDDIIRRYSGTTEPDARHWALAAQYGKDQIVGDETAIKSTVLAMLGNAPDLDDGSLYQLRNAATGLEDLSDAEISSFIEYFDAQAKKSMEPIHAILALDCKSKMMSLLKGQPERSVYKEIIDCYHDSDMKTIPNEVRRAIMKYAELAPNDAERIRLYDDAIREFMDKDHAYGAEEAMYDKYLFTGDDTELRAYYDAVIAAEGNAQETIRALFAKANLPDTVTERKAIYDRIVKTAEETEEKNRASSVVNALLRKADLEDDDDKKREICDAILDRIKGYLDKSPLYLANRVFYKKLELASDDREKVEICDAALSYFEDYPEDNASLIELHLTNKAGFQKDPKEKIAAYDAVIALLRKRDNESYNNFQLPRAEVARAELTTDKEEFATLCAALMDKYSDSESAEYFTWVLAAKKAKATGNYAEFKRFSAGCISDKASAMKKIENTVELALAYGDREKTLEIIDSLLDQYRDDKRRNVRESVDWMLWQKIPLVDDPEEKLALLNEVLDRKGDNTLSNFDFTINNVCKEKLKLAGDDRQRIAVYDEAIARYGDSASVRIRKEVDILKQARADLAEKMRKN